MGKNETQLNDLFLKIFHERLDGVEEVALMLSGGIDSNLLLLYLMELKKKVTVYTLTKEGMESRDFRTARDNADKFGLKFCPVYVPVVVDVDKVKSLIFAFKIWKKTMVEVMYLLSYIRDVCSEDIILTGLSAYFGISKKASIHYKDDLDGFTEYRSKIYESRTLQHTILGEIFGEVGTGVISPYLDKRMWSFFRTKGWRELNTPKPKSLLLNLKPEALAGIKCYAPQNLQCGDTEFREIFTPLLLNKELNGKCRKQVIDLYRDILKGEDQGLYGKV